MKVRFVRQYLDRTDLPENAADHLESIYRTDEHERIDLGRNLLLPGFESTVYAMKIRGGTPFYYVREPVHGSFTHFAAIAFDVLDDRVSRYWHMKHRIYDVESGRVPYFPKIQVSTFAIREWIEEPRFLEFLVEEREREVAIMTKAALRMDEEY